MLRDCCFATRTPRDTIMPFINPTFFVYNFEEVPNCIVIFIGHGVVGVIPVHKIPKPFALLRLNCAEFEDSLLTKLNEFCNTCFFISRNEILNIFFVSDTKFLLYLYFYPQPLTIKTVLKALFVPSHVPESLPEIFVGPSPAMMNTHGIVGCNRSVKKRKFFI